MLFFCLFLTLFLFFFFIATRGRLSWRSWGDTAGRHLLFHTHIYIILRDIHLVLVATKSYACNQILQKAYLRLWKCRMINVECSNTDKWVRLQLKCQSSILCRYIVWHCTGVIPWSRKFSIDNRWKIDSGGNRTHNLWIASHVVD